MVNRVEIRITSFAEEKLKSIHSYYLLEASQEVATKMVLSILNKIDSLARFPKKGVIEPHLRFLGLEHRFLVVKPYKIIYRVVDRKVIILDVFHTSQNPIDLVLPQI